MSIGACTGTVKWFDSSKGYGFLSCDGREKDVFLHANAIRKSSLDATAVQEGDEFHFDVEASGKGERAVNLSRI